MSTRRTRIRHRNRRRASSRLVVILFSILLAIVGLTFASVVGWIVAIASTGPDIKDLKPRQNGTSSQVFAADGTRLGFIQSPIVRQQISSTQIEVMPWMEIINRSSSNARLQVLPRRQAKSGSLPGWHSAID